MEFSSDRSASDAGHPAGPGPARDRLSVALDRLVDRDVLSRPQADAVLAEVAARSRPARPSGRRGLLGEIAGYLGASFVVGATLLFLSEQWGVLGRPGRFLILAAMAAVLFGSGLVSRQRAQLGDDVRRRLSSTLMTGAAAAAGFAAFALLDQSANDLAPPSNRPPFVGTVTALVVVVAGYLLARTALGQLGMAVAAVATYSTFLELVGVDSSVALGVGVLLLGVLWAGLAWRRLVAEHLFALAIAVALGLSGAQIVLFEDRPAGNVLAYVLTAVVAGGCFTAYAKVREWVLLAGGVAGATVVVPEILYDVTDGSLGASGVMLVAGLTLLAGSLVGLRIRRDPGAGGVPQTP
jgi:hypothetical protein